MFLNQTGGGGHWDELTAKELVALVGLGAENQETTVWSVGSDHAAPFRSC